MSENEDVIRTMLELANRHDAAAIHAYLGEAMGSIDPAAGSSPASRIHAVQAALVAAFPDIRYRIDRMLPVGNTVVVECTLSGTHRGEFAGVPPTNRPIELQAAFLLEIVAGKLTDCRSYFDTITLMEQIGAIPRPVQAVERTVT